MLILSEGVRSVIEAVNSQVNRREYVTDLDRYDQPEFWTLIDRQGGDCEDYALEKRRQLLEAGFSTEYVRPAICRDETGAGHAVLTIDTNRGTLVLDNRFPRVLGIDALRRLGYRFDRRQAAGGTGWVQTK